jgi:hypothetical protein
MSSVIFIGLDFSPVPARLARRIARLGRNSAGARTTCRRAIPNSEQRRLDESGRRINSIGEYRAEESPPKAWNQ